jgi:hypothetical protein
MLVRVEVRTSQGGLLLLPLDDDSNGFFIKEIDGLDPVKATLVSSSSAGVDGAQYHSSRRDPRNILVKMGVEPDWIDTTITELRKRLYEFFMPKLLVTLRFVMDDGFYVEIPARVESFNWPLFVKEPDINLSLMCFDPDFVDPHVVQASGMSVSSEAENKITYSGTVDTGGVFTVRPDRALNAFTFYLRSPDGLLQILDFSIPLLANDKLKISTVTGNKYVTLTRGGTESSALYGVSPQSAWLTFQNGDNFLRLYATGAPVPFDYEITTRYGGL